MPLCDGYLAGDEHHLGRLLPALAFFGGFAARHSRPTDALDDLVAELPHSARCECGAHHDPLHTLRLFTDIWNSGGHDIFPGAICCIQVPQEVCLLLVSSKRVPST